MKQVIFFKMEQVIASKRYEEAVKFIQKYVEVSETNKEEKQELVSLYHRLTVDKEDPVVIYNRVHNLTYGIWLRGYIEHERGYMLCVIL